MEGIYTHRLLERQVYKRREIVCDITYFLEGIIEICIYTNLWKSSIIDCNVIPSMVSFIASSIL